MSVSDRLRSCLKRAWVRSVVQKCAGLSFSIHAQKEEASYASGRVDILQVAALEYLHVKNRSAETGMRGGVTFGQFPVFLQNS